MRTENSPVEKTNAESLAVWKPSEPLEPKTTAKYMPIPGKYLRKTFECIRYRGILMGT